MNLMDIKATFNLSLLLHDQFSILTGRQLLMLHAGKFVGDVGASDVHFQRRHPHFAVGMVEKVLEHVVDGSLRHDQFLEVLGAKLVAKLIHGADENRLDLCED